jgi:hypothetical protein
VKVSRLMVRSEMTIREPAESETARMIPLLSLDPWNRCRPFISISSPIGESYPHLLVKNHQVPVVVRLELLLCRERDRR